MLRICMSSALNLCAILFLSCGTFIRSSDQCGQDLNGDSGQLISPGFPNTYPLGVTCQWTITVERGKSINLRLVILNTDSKQDLDGGDVLRVYKVDPQLNRNVTAEWEFSGTVQDNTVIDTNSSKLWIHFQADNQQLQENSRFNITFHSVSTQYCPQPEPLRNGSRKGDSFRVGSLVEFSCDPGFTVSGPTNISCQLNDSGLPYWTRDIPQCYIPCVNGKITDTVEGQSNLVRYFLVPNEKPVILSPNFQQYQTSGNNSDSRIKFPVQCTWAIHAPIGYAINITASQFNLHVENENGSFLTVKNEQMQSPSVSEGILANFSSHFTNLLINQTNQVLIQLTSNNLYDSFELRYNLVHPFACGSPPTPTNMFYIPNNMTYPVGHQIEYRCKDGFYLQRPNSMHINNICTSQGWLYGSQALPQCKTYCKIWDTNNETYRDILLRRSSGIIYSPGYPGPLLPGPCQITIDVHPSQIVKVTLRNMTFGNDSEVKVKLFDGAEELALISVTSPLGTISSRTNTVTVKIDNKETNPVDGHFILSYQAVPTNTCGKPKMIQNGQLLADESRYEVGSTVQFVCDAFFQRHGPQSITCINMGLFNDWQGSPSCTGKCGGQYNMGEGTIVSPNYPMPFNTSGRLCMWLITVPGEKKRFSITIPQIHISNMDDLSITENQRTTSIQTICTEDCSTLQLYTHTNAFQVSFRSASETITPTSQFKIKFVAFDSSVCSPPPEIENGVVIGLNYSVGSQVMYHCLPPFDLIGASLLTCQDVHHGVPQWQPHTPECRICRPQDRQLEPMLRHGGEGAVASPGYPDNQTLGHQSCTWKIEAKENELIMLYFRYFQLPNAEEGVVFVDIYDGQTKLESRLARLDGKTETVENITSATNIVIISYSMPLETKDTRGFYIEYGSFRPPMETTPFVPVKTEEKWTEMVTSDFQPKETTKVVTERRTSPAWINPIERTTLEILPPDQRVTKTIVFYPTKPVPTTATTPKNGHVQAVASAPGDNKGAIAAGVIVPLLIITAVGVVGFLVWYRKKYPVRMSFGREFAKFTNPAYVRKSTPGLTLVQEGHVSLCSDPSARRPSDEGGSSNEGPGKGIINPAFEELAEDDVEVPSVPEVTFTEVTPFSEEISPVHSKRSHRSSVHSDVSSARRKSAKLKITPQDLDRDYENVCHSPPWDSSSAGSEGHPHSPGRRSTSLRETEFIESEGLPSRSSSLLTDGKRKASSIGSEVNTTRPGGRSSSAREAQSLKYGDLPKRSASLMEDGRRKMPSIVSQEVAFSPDKTLRHTTEINESENVPNRSESLLEGERRKTPSVGSENLSENARKMSNSSSDTESSKSGEVPSRSGSLIQGRHKPPSKKSGADSCDPYSHWLENEEAENVEHKKIDNGKQAENLMQEDEEVAIEDVSFIPSKNMESEVEGEFVDQSHDSLLFGSSPPPSPFKVSTAESDHLESCHSSESGSEEYLPKTKKEEMDLNDSSERKLQPEEKEMSKVNLSSTPEGENFKSLASDLLPTNDHLPSVGLESPLSERNVSPFDMTSPKVDGQLSPKPRTPSPTDEQMSPEVSVSPLAGEPLSPVHGTPSPVDEQLSVGDSVSKPREGQSASSTDQHSSSKKTLPPTADEHTPPPRDEPLSLSHRTPSQISETISPVHSSPPLHKRSPSSSSEASTPDSSISDSMEWHSAEIDPSSSDVFHSPEVGLSGQGDTLLGPHQEDVDGSPSEAETNVPKPRAKLLLKVDPDEMEVSSDASGEISDSDSTTSRELDLEFLGWTQPDAVDMDASEV
ncbi:uncharacterized protein LOC106176236 [Lingula anatina]|uniref:Uncharacterized protein LOC106176236 n=1 Tax=Lingula anatina TaxID=7574 RepID=A0A1S3JUJ0_LINAN|nr:uncharacterized protein LOC106176236 [Lingula anatina]|eukprot:XP_013413987.1 uncharacterized protein LOC106176236 [Lingula anatina]